MNAIILQILPICDQVQAPTVVVFQIIQIQENPEIPTENIKMLLVQVTQTQQQIIFYNIILYSILDGIFILSLTWVRRGRILGV